MRLSRPPLFYHLPCLRLDATAAAGRPGEMKEAKGDEGVGSGATHSH